MPLVSVIIPAYNQAQYLSDAIKSVLDQTLGDFELIVIDDGSTDHTPLVSQSFSDVRLRYIYQENSGLSAARNTGLRHSSAPFISFLDSDDLFLPEKLSILVDEMHSHPDLALAAGQAIPIDEEGRKIGKVFDKPLPKDPQNLLLGNPLHVGSVVLRRVCQEEVGYFDESLRSYEDWDLWLRLALKGYPMSWMPNPVSYYRFHTAQMTRIGAQMTQASFSVLDKVFENEDLPIGWSALRETAYSHAHLRASAQAYLARNFELARDHLHQAIQLSPDLVDGEARVLADQFIAWTELPKVHQPLRFLEGIFEHLPEDIEILHQQKREHLGRAAVQMAFQSYVNGDYKATRSAVFHALRYQPQWLINRGVMSILVRSTFR